MATKAKEQKVRQMTYITVKAAKAIASRAAREGRKPCTMASIMLQRVAR